jgi:hypothetical protein
VLALPESIAIMTACMVIPGTDMRSTLAKVSPAQARRAWEPPAIVELPIGRETKAATVEYGPDESTNPPLPASPATKLGFSFEMSFPLSVRTE